VVWLPCWVSWSCTNEQNRRSEVILIMGVAAALLAVVKTLLWRLNVGAR
jgi:hypothetical protein